jgi:hypothetical protein
MPAALTERIVARYLREAEQRERYMPVSEKTRGKTL